MRFMAFEKDGQPGLAVADEVGALHGQVGREWGKADGLAGFIAAGPDALSAAYERLQRSPAIDPMEIRVLPPLAAPGKILCIGLNYADHSAESGFEAPTYPTVFARFASGLIGHDVPIIVPRQSNQLDFEGELVAVIGRGGRNISKARALEHIAGYSIFNDGSIRDYQFKSPQWTMGKNFDDTGAFGPYFVTGDTLPPGAQGLRITTRLNGQTVQSASTSDMIFDVVTLMAELSEVMTLYAGDIIVTGTPSGVGLARKPQLFMKHGDVCEVEIEGIGILRNPIRAAGDR